VYRTSVGSGDMPYEVDRTVGIPRDDLRRGRVNLSSTKRRNWNRTQGLSEIALGGYPIRTVVRRAGVGSGVCPPEAVAMWTHVIERHSEDFGSDSIRAVRILPSNLFAQYIPASQTHQTR
jgi:hypothetical protein